MPFLQDLFIPTGRNTGLRCLRFLLVRDSYNPRCARFNLRCALLLFVCEVRFFTRLGALVLPTVHNFLHAVHLFSVNWVFHLLLLHTYMGFCFSWPNPFQQDSQLTTCEPIPSTHNCSSAHTHGQSQLLPQVHNHYIHADVHTYMLGLCLLLQPTCKVQPNQSLHLFHSVVRSATTCFPCQRLRGATSTATCLQVRSSQRPVSCFVGCNKKI